MDRRDFLKTSVLGGVAVAATSGAILTSCCEKPAVGSDTPLRISFQENNAPGETLAERFDFMEAHGVTGFEPGGRGLRERVPELKELLSGRNIKVSAICAGFSGFILSTEEAVRAEFDRTMKEIIVAAGELESTGVIMVPAFNSQVPVMPHTPETREYLVEQLRLLGDYAVSHGTTVILEPLNRTEAFFLRQVADAASICRDANHDGVKCMGDFWHMSKEETSDYGAFYSAGQEYLQHVHIASLGKRRIPGEDGELDNYIDGFRALKQLNYPYYVSFECWSEGDRSVLIPAALELIRKQWEQA